MPVHAFSMTKAILKARILLKADQSEDGEEWTDVEICGALDTNISMVTKVRAKLVNEGLDAVLVRKKRERPEANELPLRTASFGPMGPTPTGLTPAAV